MRVFYAVVCCDVLCYFLLNIMPNVFEVVVCCAGLHASLNVNLNVFEASPIVDYEHDVGYPREFIESVKFMLQVCSKKISAIMIFRHKTYEINKVRKMMYCWVFGIAAKFDCQRSVCQALRMHIVRFLNNFERFEDLLLPSQAALDSQVAGFLVGLCRSCVGSR